MRPSFVRRTVGDDRVVRVERGLEVLHGALRGDQLVDASELSGYEALLGNEQRDRAADDFGRAVPEQALGGAVPGGHGAGRVDGDDRLGAGRDDVELGVAWHRRFRIGRMHDGAHSHLRAARM